MIDPKKKNSFKIDLQGLKCPFPVLKLKKRVRVLPGGASVTILSTDQTTLRDIPAYCELIGHKVLDVETIGQSYKFRIQLASES